MCEGEKEKEKEEEEEEKEEEKKEEEEEEKLEVDRSYLVSKHIPSGILPSIRPYLLNLPQTVSPNEDQRDHLSLCRTFLIQFTIGTLSPLCNFTEPFINKSNIYKNLWSTVKALLKHIKCLH